MLLQPNKFKQIFNTREQVLFGLWLGLTDPVAAEISAGAGFDWLLIDDEHAPFDVRAILAVLQTLKAYEVAPIVRPVNHDQGHLKKLLDIGVQNFLVPMVNTVDEVEQLAQSLMYPPRGVRGIGTSLARAAKWNRITDYITRANDEICLIIQAETITALDNLDAMLAHDAVDGVFIGPSDLGAAMGYPAQTNHPEVVAAVGNAISKISKAGKPAGVLAVTPELVETYKNFGATFIGVGTDTGLLSKATQSLAATYIKNASDDDSSSDSGEQAGY